ncbi:MAG TPA: GH116 family glycosyl-hydrolase [Thermoguttaceae bacterium]|nr:GH116 family glycosyl-hydrolase [Thermoguttaceae bacterium]
MDHRSLCAVAAMPALLCCMATSPNSYSAQPAVEEYAALVSAELGLVGYWRFEGDLRDAEGTAHGQPKGGEPQFGEGPGGGKALVLEDGRYVTMGDTPHLDLEETTVELWFKPTFQPGLGYNPCVIAKRADGDHRLTRFSVHIWGDYSCLAVWNGRRVMRYPVGEGPLERGQWYYLVVTCKGPQMQLFVDGVPCELEGVQDSVNFEQVGRPLSIGSSQPAGRELLDCWVNEVAIYRRALCECEIEAHADAMGWGERRGELARAREARLRRVQQLHVEQAAEREERRAELMADPALFARGEPFVYRDEHLGAVSLPLGGIGTGCIQINGQGERHVWQIFNNHKHALVPHSFFAVRVKKGKDEPVVRALQTTPVGPFPAMKSLSFRGEYPFGWYEFEDGELGVKVSMETFNPLVPLDARSSAMPCAVFNLSVENPTDQPVEVALLATQQNAAGYLGDNPIDGRAYPGYGGNQIRVLRDPGAALLQMTSNKPADAPGSGDMVLMAAAEPTTAAASWESLDELAAGFAAGGSLSGPEHAGPSPAGETLDGALAVSFPLQPAERRMVPFVLAWHFPTGRHGNGAWGGEGNMYSSFWPDALAVARDVQANLDELTRKTRLYHDTLYASNLPRWLLDRISSQVAILRSRTCFWTRDGYFGGWEGCCPETGCCAGNCNHVWHYAQAHARLFPSIAKQMRAQEFQFQSPDGAIPHRQPKSFPAFDGQCGAVLNSYREHLMSPDGKWLDENWPSTKRAMDYVIATWDRDEDGVPAGAQWNTLDGALGGSSSWLGTMYLAALAAAEKMAVLQSEPEPAQRYARIRESGSNRQDATLFGGEYYIQIPEETPHEDYGTGCHIDQVLGQWWAHQLDLGSVYPRDHVRTALGSLFKHNFRGKMAGLPQLPRKFAADEDPGMQMIVWPEGEERPAKVIRYGDEVMTGFEYAAAAAMVQAGLLREGFAVCRAVAIRYDGRLREGLTPSRSASWGYSGNPFGDDECGKFYARAMSVWSMLLASQGFVYDGPAGHLGFKPVWQPEDHASLFTSAEGWGLFRQRREDDTQTERIEVRYGSLRVASLVFQLPKDRQPTQVAVRVGQGPARSTFAVSGSEVRIELEGPVVLGADQVLLAEIKLEYGY